MTTYKYFPLRAFLLVVFFGAALFIGISRTGYAAEPQKVKPLMLTEPKENLDERLQRKIALDVRDMNIVDVLKFLAMKGEFNIVISPAVDGRTTVLLDNVAIKDAMDIVVVSNRLAYSIQSNIIQVMTAVEYEAMFGKPFGDKTIVETVHLQYAKPSYVLAALDSIKSNVGKIIIDEDTGSVVLIDTPETIVKMKKTLGEIEQPLETLVFNLQYAKADVVADKLRMRIDAKSVGSITADERSNQLVVRVFPGRKEEIEKTIRHLDEPAKEVMIEARILQVIMKPNYSAGIDWAYVAKDNANGFGQITLASKSPTTSTGFGQVSFGQVDVNRFVANIKMLQQVSDTKILSSPQIMAVNNEESKIHIGDTVPYIISTVSGTGDNAITSEDVRFVDVGLKLNVTPTINDDGMITMRLRPEISSVVAVVPSTNPKNTGGIPQVNKTEVETTLVVQDGTTIIMAGLRKDDKKHIKTGVPLLMDVPFMGKIFSQNTDSTEATEIVIFITPHIMTGKENYKAADGSIKPSKSYN